MERSDISYGRFGWWLLAVAAASTGLRNTLWLLLFVSVAGVMIGLADRLLCHLTHVAVPRYMWGVALAISAVWWWQVVAGKPGRIGAFWSVLAAVPALTDRAAYVPARQVWWSAGVCLLIGLVRELLSTGQLYGYAVWPTSLPILSRGFANGGIGLIVAGLLVGVCLGHLPLRWGKRPLSFLSRIHEPFGTGRSAGVPLALTVLGLGWLTVTAWI